MDAVSAAAAAEALRVCVGQCSTTLEVETDRMVETIDSARDEYNMSLLQSNEAIY